MMAPVGRRSFSSQPDGKKDQASQSNFYEPSKQHRLFNIFAPGANSYSAQVENPYT